MKYTPPYTSWQTLITWLKTNPGKDVMVKALRHEARGRMRITIMRKLFNRIKQIEWDNLTKR